MPVKTCLSNLLSTRFEFGVPLEDVFPPNDIHPRLKYLFGKAYESYIKHGYNIEITLRQEQGSMKERLNLKEKLVLDLDYHIDLEEFYPGSYFWVLRHFLGLLPLPLLPKYTKGIQFDWGSLADDCKSYLQNYGNQHQDKHVLDYEIAQILNMLPFENFVLLNVLLVFLRKVSSKNIRSRLKLNRKPLLVLSKYFCSSIFVRPYRPGYHPMNDSHLPLLLYLILRWQKVSSHCESIGHPAFFLECDIKNLETYNSLGQKDNCTQTNILSNAFFNPEVISVCRNIPYFVTVCNNYLRDIGCQTDLCIEKNGASYCRPILEENEESDANLNDKDNTRSSVNEIGKNGNNTDYKLAYIEEELDNISAKDGGEDENTLYQTATDFSFNSVNKGQDWQNIVKDTMKTVKRIEESYIYDDYETFKKEDFNQIGKNRSRSFLSKISKHGFTYTPSKKLDIQEAGITSTPKKESSDSDTSYVKYPDVCENVDLKDYRIDQYNTEVKSDYGKIDIMKSAKSVSQKLFQDDSPMDIQADNSKQDLQNDTSNKKKNKKYMLKRIRLSLEFLRALTPKRSTFKMIKSKVKYHRMKNAKPYTI